MIFSKACIDKLIIKSNAVLAHLGYSYWLIEVICIGSIILQIVNDFEWSS